MMGAKTRVWFSRQLFSKAASRGQPVQCSEAVSVEAAFRGRARQPAQARTRRQPPWMRHSQLGGAGWSCLVAAIVCVRARP